jgi:hypothetical protein
MIQLEQILLGGFLFSGERIPIRISHIHPDPAVQFSLACT